MTASTTDTDNPPALDLDPARIGQIILMLVPASASARHRQPAETLRDYVSPRGDRELEFIRDLFTKPTEELAERWYCGMDWATTLADYGREMMWG